MPSGNLANFGKKDPLFPDCDCSGDCVVCLEMSGIPQPRATESELSVSDELERLVVSGRLNGLWEMPSLSV